MGDYLVSQKCPPSPSSTDKIETNNVVIKEEFIPPTSPTATVLQGHTRSPEDVGTIRLRPLESLIHNETETKEQSDVTQQQQQQGPLSNNGKSNAHSSTSLALVPLSNPPAQNRFSANCFDWRSQCRGSSIKNRLKYALEKSNFYQDVTFSVGKDGERISAHKLILRLGSPVLERLMEGQQRKSTTHTNNAKMEIIELREIEPLAFHYLLKFIYTDEFNAKGLKCSSVMSILHAARKLEVQELASQAVRVLKTHINDETAVQLCELGKDVEDLELRDLAIQYICRNAKRIFFSTNFMDMSYANLVLLIENDDLEWDELSIFKSVLRWADQFCLRRGLEPVASNLRGALGEIIYKIRFPLMTSKEFTFEVPLNVLTSEEQVQIYKYLCLPDTAAREQLEPTAFSCKKRTHLLRMSKFKEDESLLKIKNEAGDSSPYPYQPALTSSFSAENEAESEDTSSQVSSCLSSGTAPRHKKIKRSRSTSPQSPSDNKKQLLFGKSPPKKAKEISSRRRSKDSVIEMDQGEIEFSKFIETVANNPNRRDIEVVRLSEVNITDHDKIQKKKVRLPKLKEFHLDIKIPCLSNKVKTLASEISLEDYLFFFMKVSKKWAMNEIWGLGVNISIVVNGITLLRLDHDKNFVVINNKVKDDCAKILESLECDSNLKSLVIASHKFPGSIDSYPAVSLQRLVILSVDQIPEFNSFIRTFKKLTELSILSTERKHIDLSNDFSKECRLKKLSVGSCSFSATAPIIPLKTLEELFFWRCEWDSNFEDMIPSLFPNLKKVSFFLGNKITVKMLFKVFQIKTISEVGCGSFDWTSTSGVDKSESRVVTTILESASLCETDKTFVLSKSNSEWTGRKGSFDLSQEEIFQKFQFYHLYADYALFRS